MNLEFFLLLYQNMTIRGASLYDRRVKWTLNKLSLEDKVEVH
jgi:hypothetical protein